MAHVVNRLGAYSNGDVSSATQRTISGFGSAEVDLAAL